MSTPNFDNSGANNTEKVPVMNTLSRVNEVNRTVLQIIEFLDRKAKVIRHSGSAYYTYVDGRQYPAKLVNQADRQRYELRCQRRKDYAIWSAAAAKFQNEKMERDQVLLVGSTVDALTLPPPAEKTPEGSGKTDVSPATGGTPTP